jgi:hypothetical protein
MNAHELRDSLLSRLSGAKEDECIEILHLLKASNNVPRLAELEALCERELSIKLMLPGLAIDAENHLKDLVLQKLLPIPEPLLLHPLAKLLEKTEISTVTLKIVLEICARNSRNSEFLSVILPALNPHADRFPASFFELLLNRSDTNILQSALRAVRNLPQPALTKLLHKLSQSSDPEIASLALENLWLQGESLLLKRFRQEISVPDSQLLEKLAISLHRINQDPLATEILIKLSEHSDESVVLASLRSLYSIGVSKPLDTNTIRIILESALMDKSLYFCLIKVQLCFFSDEELSRSIMEDFMEIFPSPHKAQLNLWLRCNTTPAEIALSTCPSLSRLYYNKEKYHASSS